MKLLKLFNVSSVAWRHFLGQKNCLVQHLVRVTFNAASRTWYFRPIEVLLFVSDSTTTPGTVFLMFAVKSLLPMGYI